MRQFWMISCPKCNKATTGAEPPKSADFVAVVPCNLCNEPLDAANGHFVLHPVRIKKPEPIDLLAVE